MQPTISTEPAHGRYALSDSLKKQLNQPSSLQRLREELSREIPKLSNAQDDIGVALKGLDRLLAFSQQRQKNNSDCLAQFNDLFDRTLRSEVQSRQIAQWQRRWVNRITPEMKKLRVVLNNTHELVSRVTSCTSESKSQNQKAELLEREISGWNAEAEILVKFINGEREQVASLCNPDALPHLYQAANHMLNYSLKAEHAEILHQLVQRQNNFSNCQEPEHYEIEAHCQAIETLTHRFQREPSGVLADICDLLKLQMQLIEKASNQQPLPQSAIEQINQQVTEKLLAMKHETEQLVKNLSSQQYEPERHFFDAEQSDHDICRKRIEDYEKQLMELSSKMEEKSSQCQSLRRVRDSSRFKEESTANHLRFMQSQNASLKASLEMQQGVYSPNDYEKEIERLRAQLSIINGQVETLVANQTRDLAEIDRLKLLISDYEHQENASRKQLEELVARVSYRHKERREEYAEKRRDVPSEDHILLRLRELEEDAEVYITVNEIYVENQKNLQSKIADLQKQNSKLLKKKAKLQQQIKELHGGISVAGSNDTGVLPGQQAHSGSEEGWFKREKQLNEKILRLTFSLETIKAEYLQQVRRRSAITQKLEDISNEQGGFVDDRVQLYADKRTLEDQNRNLFEALDKAQVQLAELQKINRKLVKSQKEKIRLIEYLQRQNMQLSNIKLDADTQRTYELTSTRLNRNQNESKKEDDRELTQLKAQIRHLQEEKDFYIKTIEDQIISSRTIEFQSKLEQLKARNSQLEKELLQRSPPLQTPSESDPEASKPANSKLLATKNAQLTELVQQYDDELKWLKDSINRLEADNQAAGQQNERCRKEIRRLEKIIEGNKNGPIVSRLPLRENGQPSHPISSHPHSSDYLSLRERLVESLGWKDVIPLFKDYISSRKGDTLHKLQSILLSS